MGNHNSGRRPQPTALKVLRGNPSKTRLNELEPKPPAGEAQKPEALSVVAGVVWDRLAPVCQAMGTLTSADADSFATLCELQASMDAARQLKDLPEFTAIHEGRVHEAIKLEKDLAPVIRPFYALFGLEPISRAKIQVQKSDEPVSKWAGVLK